MAFKFKRSEEDIKTKLSEVIGVQQSDINLHHVLQIPHILLLGLEELVREKTVHLYVVSTISPNAYYLVGENDEGKFSIVREMSGDESLINALILGLEGNRSCLECGWRKKDHGCYVWENLFDIVENVILITRDRKIPDVQKFTAEWIASECMYFEKES